jgi:uncharacterized protein YndB with AHSA1/START domain
MTTTTAEVRTAIVVPASPERAFEVFTSGLNGWWNREHHLQSGTLKDVGVEPFVGGRVWEENDAGDVCAWGRVLTWDPPATFAFAWLIGTDWAVPPPDAVGSRVTVTFTQLEAGTQVELVHDQLDAHGEGWETMRDGVGGPAGWPDLLRRFAEAV